MKKAYLVLEDGHVFEGERFGADGETVGELVFNTGMVGYIETLTDPCFYGQIVMQTFPLIGNYGMIEEDTQSDKCYLSGLVVREWCEEPSNFRSEGTIDEYLKKQNIVALCNVDTREITQIIREKGVMNAKIVDEVTDGIFDSVKEYKIVGAVKNTAKQEKKEIDCENTKLTAAVIDFGETRNIAENLSSLGCRTVILPYDTSAQEILASGFDGVVLSCGPGDPNELKEAVKETAELVGKLPVFGIGLGHQVLALAMGGETEKLKFGHRGANQPVKDLSNGKTYITSQNHGYAVKADSLKNKGEETFVSVNDGTNEGMNYPEYNAFSVQFHFEECSGPKNPALLFEKFMGMMGEKNNAAE